MNQELDQIIEKYIPFLEKDCRIIRAQKQVKRFEMKRELLLFVAKNFIPKQSEQQGQQGILS